MLQTEVLSSCVRGRGRTSTSPLSLGSLRLSYSGVLVVTLLKQGNVLGVGNSDGTVQLWDVASSKLIRSMGGHTDRVSRRVNIVPWCGCFAI